jgi:Ca2+-binding EF-hand superfamily protein
MIARLLTAAAVALALLPWAAAADDPPPATPQSAGGADFQDVVFLRGPRPVLLRLHLRIDGKPFQAVWDDYLDTLFDFLDRDNDGVLNFEEAGRAPRAQALAQQVQGRGFNPFGQPMAALTPAELGVDPEAGEVTREDLAAYYRKAGFRPLVLVQGQGQGAVSDALTDALFRYLDRDGDGKLSKQELEQAEVTLRKLDMDDDETVSAQEILPTGTPFGVPQPPAVTPGTVAPFLLVEPTESGAAAVAVQILKLYDKDKNQKLSHEEIRLDWQVFDRLDTDKDGELDILELTKYASMPPDLSLVVRLGRTGEREEPADLMPGRAEPLSAKAGKSNGGVTVSVGPANVEVRRSEAPVANFNNTRQFYLNFFRQADQAKKGFVERKDLQQNRQFQFLINAFGPADRDEDGKLTEKELTAYLDLQDRAATSYTVLTISDQGRGLMDALDANRDGRLSVRELRSAWDRLAPYDTDGKGTITRTMIPTQYRLLASRGQPGFDPRLSFTPRPQPVQPPVPPRGPLWFRKMDRNADGDVSFREWLGTPEEFRRIDRDGDGIITLEEAERADTEARSQAAEPRR